MKRNLLYILFFITAMAGAQTVTIPDPYFKGKLLSATTLNGVAKDSSGNVIIVDANGDSEIQQTEALAVYELNISNSGISNLAGVEAFINLTILDGSYNNFTDLDLSSQVNLVFFNLGYCSNLQNVYLKNGSNQIIDNATFFNCSSLSLICADEDEIDTIQQFLATTYGVNAYASVSSYCTFTPGGIYNTITGTITSDANSNGCDTADAPWPFLKIKINDGTTNGYAFTDSAGHYTFYTQAGTFIISPDFEDPLYFTAALPSAVVVFPVVDGSVHTENFCVTANGSSPDLEVVMEPVTNAQPGYNAQYKIVYKNKGNQVLLLGSVSCVWNSSILTTISMTPAANYSGTDTYSWNYTNLQPFESREILMTLHISPAIPIGNTISFSASGNSYPSDIAYTDNSFTLNQTAVASMDVNNIVCVEGNEEPVTSIGNYLHYVVNFENTGTQTADFVVVQQDIDTSLYDISSVQLLNSSHAVAARIIGSKIEFVMQNAALAAMAHGNILFKIKTKPNLTEGIVVNAQAKIIFDYNDPITTNEASTVFGTLSTGDFVKDNSVIVYPNPANGLVNIKAEGTIQSVQLYDVQGRILQTGIVNNTTTVIDLSSRTTGVYFIKVTTNKGVKVEKVVRE